MDVLSIAGVTFPVVRGTIGRLDPGAVERPGWDWVIEIACSESAQREEDELALSGMPAALEAATLPLGDGPIESLIGRTIVLDDHAPSAEGGWPFFVVYVHEHDCVHHGRVTFLARDGDRVRVRIEGAVVYGRERPLRVECWLTPE